MDVSEIRTPFLVDGLHYKTTIQEILFIIWVAALISTIADFFTITKRSCCEPEPCNRYSLEIPRYRKVEIRSNRLDSSGQKSQARLLFFCGNGSRFLIFRF